MTPKIVEVKEGKNCRILCFSDGSEKIVYISSGGQKQEVCKDGVIRTVYVSRYPSERRCVDCHFYEFFGFDPDRDDLKEMVGWCKWFNPARPHRIPKDVFEGEKPCENFRLCMITKEYDRAKGTMADFCRDWNKLPK